MKKFFAIAVIASAMVACNNSSDSKTSTDTTAVKPDTAVVVPADTTHHVDTTVVKADTSAKKK
jgi:hypothetical protein